jgi:hypothetical protein
MLLIYCTLDLLEGFDSTAPQFEFIMHATPKLVIVEGPA